MILGSSKIPGGRPMYRNMLEMFADKVPSMKNQAAVAAISYDYVDVYVMLQPTTHWL
jgi:hypothetical protein